MPPVARTCPHPALHSPRNNELKNKLEKYIFAKIDHHQKNSECRTRAATKKVITILWRRSFADGATVCGELMAGGFPFAPIRVVTACALIEMCVCVCVGIELSFSGEDANRDQFRSSCATQKCICRLQMKPKYCVAVHRRPFACVAQSTNDETRPTTSIAVHFLETTHGGYGLRCIYVSQTTVLPGIGLAYLMM